MPSGPRVLLWLPSDSANHPQMLREGRGEEGRGREEETGHKEGQYGNSEKESQIHIYQKSPKRLGTIKYT